jgi:uncharacterized protein
VSGAAISTALFLVGAGILAATIGSAGGITSLISFPALLVVGMTPLAANVTNAVALVASGFGSTMGSQPELSGQRARLTQLALPAIAGGTAGALLLLVTPPGVFAGVVPFLIAFASVLLLVQPAISTWRQARHPAGSSALAMAGVFVLSVYDGYFGAGAGVLTLALLLILVEQDLARANALKNVALLVADVITAVVFIVAGPVAWTSVVPLAVGALVGGRLGPLVARRVPTTLLRVVVALSGLGLATWLWHRSP